MTENHTTTNPPRAHPTEAEARGASLILRLARHLRELWQRSTELDRLTFAGAADLARAGAHSEDTVREWQRTVSEAIDATETVILAIPPQLLDEACVQLMIASDRLGLIRNRTRPLADGFDVDERTCRRAMVCAIEVIQCGLGGRWIDMREYGAEHYGYGLPSPYFEGRNRFEIAA